MSIRRMRTATGLLEELQRGDPDTPVTLHFIRQALKSKRVPVIRAGNRRLCDFGLFLEYLQRGDDPPPDPGGPEPGQVRRVS